MNKLTKLRAWANKDDGTMYQIGNRRLNPIEIIGYLLLIISMLVYVFYTKAGIGSAWLGWSTLAVGLIMVVLGGIMSISNESNT